MSADEFGVTVEQRIELLARRLELALSVERLQSFRRPGDSTFETLVNYHWNIALCEALYPALHAAEVALRNSIHAGMTEQHGAADWLEDATRFEPRQVEQVRAAIRDLATRGHIPTPGRIVAQLSFGFWVTLLSKPYETRIWDADRFRLLAVVFPHTSRRERTRWNIYRRLADISLLRNRVFHHEPVWNGMYVVTRRQHHTLPALHDDIHAAIGWISPELRASIGLFDQFSDTFAGGHETIAATLSEHITRD